MLELSSVELARAMEKDIQAVLFETRNRCHSSEAYKAGKIADLYEIIIAKPYAHQITTGFFHKILADLRKAGVVITKNGDRTVYLSDSAHTRMIKVAAQRERINNLVAALGGVWNLSYSFNRFFPWNNGNVNRDLTAVHDSVLQEFINEMEKTVAATSKAGAR